MGLAEVVTTNNRMKAAHHSRESSTSSTASSGVCSVDEAHWEPNLSRYSKSNPTNELALNPRTLGQTNSEEHVTKDPLQAELEETRIELERSQAEVARLGRVRDDVEAEVRELTASLFQEAHAMVREANLKAAAAEKALREANMQVDVLQAEVNALKTLVITSTPSQPNAHLHPQLSSSLSSSNIIVPTPPKANGLKIFTRHRRGASDCDLKYGGSISHNENGILPVSSEIVDSVPVDPVNGEVDPICFNEFQLWRQNPSLTRNSPFMGRVFSEDADRCLDFPNEDLSRRVQQAVEKNCIYIEEISEQLPLRCALLNTHRVCRYRMKVDDDNQWHPISQLCRNRITAVCDFLSYLRYIQLGLVKAPVNEVYWQIIRLRKQMTLARLGIQ